MDNYSDLGADTVHKKACESKGFIYTNLFSAAVNVTL